MIGLLSGVQIIEGPVIIAFYAASIALVLYLLMRKPNIRWVTTALIGLIGGSAIGAGTYFLVTVLGLFGADLPIQIVFWTVATFGAVGLAVINLWRSRWWRKVTAALGIVMFAITGTLGINAYYGLDGTLGALFGLNTSKSISLPVTTDTPTAEPARPVYQTWSPPADLAKKGTVSQVDIPGTTSGFKPRKAGLYLPPAALAENAPPLPLVIMMMGQPGIPDANYVAPTLDTFATANEGLAPIVIVADQLGQDPLVDSLCLDTPRGSSESYITTDVSRWARTHLKILTSAKSWAVAGFSNGGECAIYFGAKYPQTWGNLLDMSGNEFPGQDAQSATLHAIFNGNQAAYDAAKPASILARSTYPDTVAVFTGGTADPEFSAATRRNQEAAQKAGMKTTFIAIPGAGHSVAALDAGLKKAFDILYPRWGLKAP